MNRVRIGRIVGTHGLRGALKVVPLTDYPERFHSMEKMSVYSAEGQPITTLTLLSSQYSDHKKLLVIQTEELRRIEDAAPLSGAFIEVFPEERYPLGEGEYWIEDLKGLSAVRHEDGTPLGKVVDVVTAGENDLYVIRDDSGVDHYIPAVKQFIAEVNLEKRELRILLIEGLWESCM